MTNVLVKGQAVQDAPAANAAAPVRRELLIGPSPVAQEPTLLFGSLQHGEFRLRRPITLSITAERGAAVVSWPETDITVTGATLSEALKKFRTVVLQRAADSQLGEYIDRLAL